MLCCYMLGVTYITYIYILSVLIRVILLYTRNWLIISKMKLVQIYGYVTQVTILVSLILFSVINLMGAWGAFGARPQRRR